jgi:hypothetical protein
MIRRRAVRERLGEAGFGRRRPKINSAEIKEEISYFRRLAIIARNFANGGVKEVLAENKTAEQSAVGSELKKTVKYKSVNQIELNPK